MANSGSPFKQWERGLRVASGKYIWIAESDDSCASDFLSSLLAPLERDGLSLAFSRVQTIDATSSYLETPYWPEPLNREFFRTSQIASCRFFLQHFMGARNCFPNASAVVFRADGFKTEILELINSVNSLKFAGDWIFWAKLLAVYGDEYMLCSAEPLCLHRMHADTTRAALDKAGEKARICEFSTAINTINLIRPAFSLGRIFRLLSSDSWDWSYAIFSQRYQPSPLEKLSGSPLHGLHRFGYIFYGLRCLNARLKMRLSHRRSVGSI